MWLFIALAACRSESTMPMCEVTPRLDQAEGWLLGPTSWRVTAVDGRVSLPPEATAGSWTLAFPGFEPAPVTLTAATGASPTLCLPTKTELAPARHTIAGRVWGLAGGARAEVVGCGGMAITTTTGHFDLPVSGLPCEVMVLLDGEVKLVHSPVRAEERPLDLSLRLPSLGVGLVGEGPPFVVASHRGDDELLPGDTILSVEGVQTPNAAAVLALVGKHTPGTRVDLVVRRDDQPTTLRVALIAKWEDDSGVHFDPLLP